jgi:hypothetical protein
VKVAGPVREGDFRHIRPLFGTGTVARMTPTLLLASLLTLSAGIDLSENAEARQVSLTESSFDLTTRRRAEVRLTELDKVRPQLGGAIALVSVGAPFFVGGAVSVGLGLSYIGFVSTAAGVGSLFAGIVPYFLIGAGLIFGVIPGAIMLYVGIKTLLLRQANVQETRNLSVRLERRDPAVIPSAPPPAQVNLVVPGEMVTALTF